MAMPNAMAASFSTMRLEWQGAMWPWPSAPSGMTPKNIMQPGMRWST